MRLYNPKEVLIEQTIKRKEEAYQVKIPPYGYSVDLSPDEAKAILKIYKFLEKTDMPPEVLEEKQMTPERAVENEQAIHLLKKELFTENEELVLKIQKKLEALEDKNYMDVMVELAQIAMRIDNNVEMINKKTKPPYFDRIVFFIYTSLKRFIRFNSKKNWQRRFLGTKFRIKNRLRNWENRMRRLTK